MSLHVLEVARFAVETGQDAMQHVRIIEAQHHLLLVQEQFKLGLFSCRHLALW